MLPSKLVSAFDADLSVLVFQRRDGKVLGVNIVDPVDVGQCGRLPAG